MQHLDLGMNAGVTYLLHLAHACIPGRRECAIEPHGAGEPPMPEIGSRPAKKTGGGGNGIDARKRPCRSGPRALVAVAGSSPPKGRGREALPAGRAGVAECGQGSAKGPRRPANNSVCRHAGEEPQNMRARNLFFACFLIGKSQHHSACHWFEIPSTARSDLDQ
jgi:hypothetical protein